MNRLQAQERVGNLAHPRPRVTSPVLRNDVVEHGSPGLSFKLERLQAGEAAAEPVGAGGVAKGDGDVLTGDGVDLVPLLADEGDGVAVPGVVDVVHDALEGDIGDAEAHRSVEVSDLHRARSDPSLGVWSRSGRRFRAGSDPENSDLGGVEEFGG